MTARALVYGFQHDRIDNDHDGKRDCADPDCASVCSEAERDAWRSQPVEPAAEPACCVQAYRSEKGTKCINCPDGHQPNPAQDGCTQCVAGKAGRGGVCALCPAGKASSKHVQCKLCGPNLVKAHKGE